MTPPAGNYSGYEKVEEFKPGYGCESIGSKGGAGEPHDCSLLKEFVDNGFIWAINTFALHPYGYAIGYSIEEDGTIDRLILYRSPDERMCFGDGEAQRAFERFRNFTCEGVTHTPRHPEDDDGEEGNEQSKIG